MQQKQPAELSVIKSIAEQAPKTELPIKQNQPSSNYSQEFNLDAFIDKYNIEVRRKDSYEGGYRYILKSCPFNPVHSGTSAAIFQTSQGALGFKCQHNECANHTWTDLRELYEPGYKNRYGSNGRNGGNGNGHHQEELTDTIPVIKKFNRTDLGNAERLVAQHGDILRYNYDRKLWLIWKGTHWQWDEGGEVVRLAQKTVRKIYEEAAGEDNDDERKKLADWAKSSESNQRINAMVALAQPLVSIRLDKLDANYWLLNCKNGTINLKNGVLQPHMKEDYQTLLCPVDYDIDCKHPVWDSFLERICDGKTDVITFLQRSIGYSLTGDTQEQILFFAHGGGQNGKSTFLDTFIEIAGPYSAQANIEMFLTSYKQGNSGHSEDVANLAGKRIVVASEIEEGRRLAVPKLKQMTGGEKVRASHKYEHEFEYQVTYKIWLNGNHKPEITDTTYSIWRRVKMIPFTVTIPVDERDKKLREKLRKEYPGILAWAVQGCVEWQNKGLEDPLSVTKAITEYRQEQDLLAEFFHCNCFLDIHDAECVVSHKELFSSYQSWCADNSIDPISARTFAKRLKEKRNIQKFESSGQLKWRFIRLLKKDEAQQVVQTVDEVVVVDDFSKTILHEENKLKKGGESPTLPTSSTQTDPASSTSSTVGEVSDDIDF